MSQFVVYKNTNKNTSNAYPYFIDLQCDFLSGLNSQLVAPLTPETNFGYLQTKVGIPSF